MFTDLDVNDEKYLNIVCDAIVDGRIFFEVQDIRSVHQSCDLLYRECLARLRGLDGRIYSAGEFVPNVETLGGAPEFDRHMLKLILDRLTQDSTAVLGWNFSAENLAQERALEKILRLLSDHSHVSSRLILELTESRVINSCSMAIDFISEIKSLGYRIALDDFGAGFASPSVLRMMPFDIVKIDRAFLYDAGLSFDRKTSLQNVVSLASNFVSLIVVEGVETSSQADAAFAAGATHFQGYLLSPRQSTESYRTP